MSSEKLVISETCKEKYKPVINAIEQLLLSKEEILLIGIDGMCASGKTTLAYYLSDIFECNLFHMDDFFLQKHQRTPERLKEIGGNVDYERFKEEVLDVLLQKTTVIYRPYTCSEQKIMSKLEIPFKRLNIVEGSYCMHPYFENIYNEKVFIKLSENIQVERIINRNGIEMLDRFVNEWIPKENAYFDKFAIRKDCIVI